MPKLAKLAGFSRAISFVSGTEVKPFSWERVGVSTWSGEAPEQVYDLDGGAGLRSLVIWLHQYARRLVRRSLLFLKHCCQRAQRSRSRGLSCEQGKMHRSAIHASISRFKPREEQHARPAARHALRSSVALELAKVTTFVSIVRPCGSPPPPSLRRGRPSPHQVIASATH
jgi:hypothetical protein